MLHLESRIPTQKLESNKVSHYNFRGATSPVICRLSQCRIRLPGVCQRLCHLPQCCGKCGKPRFAGRRYSANGQRIRLPQNAEDCRQPDCRSLPTPIAGNSTGKRVCRQTICHLLPNCAGMICMIYNLQLGHC